jgi:hypothetical protein
MTPFMERHFTKRLVTRARFFWSITLNKIMNLLKQISLEDSLGFKPKRNGRILIWKRAWNLDF